MNQTFHDFMQYLTQILSSHVWLRFGDFNLWLRLDIFVKLHVHVLLYIVLGNATHGKFMNRMAIQVFSQTSVFFFQEKSFKYFSGGPNLFIMQMQIFK